MIRTHLFRVVLFRIFLFDALRLLVSQQEQHPACGVLFWRFVEIHVDGKYKIRQLGTGK